MSQPDDKTPALDADEPDRPDRRRDPELRQAEAIIRILDAFAPAAQARVIGYLHARYVEGG